MGIKIKTTRANQIIDCEGYIEGLTNGFITVSDSLTLKDIYKLINTNDYIIKDVAAISHPELTGWDIFYFLSYFFILNNIKEK